jgi:hypothetical protein
MLPFQNWESMMELQMGFNSTKELLLRGKFILILKVLLTLLIFSQGAHAAKQNERIYTAPDSHLAGLLNTEVAPEDSYQIDFTTGHIWYGIGEQSNIFTNALIDSYVLLGTPALSLGGKHRYCENTQWSCSLLLEAALGIDLVGDKRRLMGGLFQNSLSLDLDSSGRFIFGVGGSVYSTRNTSKNSLEYSDDFNSWANLAYDYPLVKEWSLGAGLGTSLKGLSQTNAGNQLNVRRLGVGVGNLFHVRTQYSFTDWQLTLGGALLSVSSNWSLWPVFEIHYRSLPSF